MHTQWDQPTDEDLVKVWWEISKDIEEATKCNFPQQYFKPDTTTDVSRQLHVFSDASTKAYGLLHICIKEKDNLCHGQNTCGPSKADDTTQIRVNGSSYCSKTSFFHHNFIY